MQGEGVKKKTKLYCLFGWPIKHSLSPLMHNAAFKALKLNSRYILFEVHPKKIKAAFSKTMWKALGICGANITIPHKETSLKFMDRLDKGAKMIGAVNTVAFKSNKFIGYNTDADGFLASLKIDANFNPRNKNVYILGAGGAGRAVGFALAKAGARSITLADIDFQRAKKLARDLSGSTNAERSRMRSLTINIEKPPLKKNSDRLKQADLLINATGVGIHKKDPLVINPKLLHSNLLVYELIYNPPVTKLMQAARRKGLRAINGLGMLLYQGALSFRIWTKRKPPVAAMKNVLRKAMQK